MSYRLLLSLLFFVLILTCKKKEVENKQNNCSEPNLGTINVLQWDTLNLSFTGNDTLYPISNGYKVSKLTRQNNNMYWVAAYFKEKPASGYFDIVYSKNGFLEKNTQTAIQIQKIDTLGRKETFYSIDACQARVRITGNCLTQVIFNNIEFQSDSSRKQKISLTIQE